MSLLLAITRQDVADYVAALFIVYIVLIFIRILLSWVEGARMPYYRWLSAFTNFVHQTTDPYLNLFRRILPPIGGSGFALDISPILAIIVLFILRAVIVGVIEPG